MSKAIARREFLKQLGRGLGFAVGTPFLTDFLLQQLVNRAWAVTTGSATSANYIHLSFPGGPPRWYFDLPLTPTGVTSKNFIAGGFGTAFDANGNVVYKTAAFKVGGQTVHLPPVWGMGLSRQDFTTLLPNTIFIRGMDMEINNHGISNGRQVAPVVGGISVTGKLADHSNLPIPGIVDLNTWAGQVFRSYKGLGAASISYSQKNPAEALLNPFKEFRGNRAAHSALQTRLQAQALEHFERSFASQGGNSGALAKMYDNAIQLMDENIISVASAWDATLAKYKSIMEEAIFPKKGTLPGLFDRAIPGAASKTATDATSLLYGNGDTAGTKVTGKDIRDMFVPGKTTSARMAENFALAELLIGRVTSNMTLAFPALTSLSLDGSEANLFSPNHDQHYMGSRVSLLATTLFYRAFLGCLTELVASLKSKGLFDSTIIHISSEFNRTPKSSGAGSDHGYMAGNTTLISGMIGECGVVGNIKVDGRAETGNSYVGTFGVADNFDLGGMNRPIQVNDVALTITSMLGIDAERVITNGRALLAPSGGRWTLKKKEAKNNA